MKINNKRLTAWRKIKGFSLLELMIAVAIIGILASIVLPGYSDYVIRTNRLDGQDRLTEVMYEQERFAVRNRTYTTSFSALGYPTTLQSAEGFYNLTAAACAGVALTRCVNLQAAPVGGTPQDGDWTFSLSSRGEQTSIHGSTVITEWTSTMPH